jgi:hypothetical protein
MTRTRALWSASPKKVVVGLVALLAAAAVAVGSGANFNSASANPSNVFSAGTLSQSNSSSGQAVLTASNLKPGDSQVGTVDIKNTGSVAGAFTLTESNIVDTPSSPSLSLRLDLKVVDLGDPNCTTNCPAPTTLYNGALNGLPSTALGSFAAGATHRYQLTVTFSNGSSSSDNTYQGAKTSVDFGFTQST